MKKVNSNIATPAEVREELTKQQRLCGGMFCPFILNEVFYELLKRDDNNIQFGIVRAMSWTYAALCNEYRLMNYNPKRTCTEFYIKQDRWEKYFIAPEMRKKCIDLLCDYEFIECGEQTLAPTNEVVQTYKIKLEGLKLCTRYAEEKKPKRR